MQHIKFIFRCGTKIVHIFVPSNLNNQKTNNMKNTKHTQGEWIVNKHPFLNVQSNGQWICQMSDLKSDKKLDYLSDEYEQEEKRLAEEQKANAKLIATAPELLQLVEELRSLLGDNMGYSALTAKREELKRLAPELDALQERAIAAINKATL